MPNIAASCESLPSLPSILAHSRYFMYTFSSACMRSMHEAHKVYLAPFLCSAAFLGGKRNLPRSQGQNTSSFPRER